jgi:superfamily II DNA or RNA helicase
VALSDVLKAISEGATSFKCATGYLYLEGLVLIINELRGLREIKILMGTETTLFTKKELLNSFKENIESFEDTSENISALALFHYLIKSKKLEILVFLGDEKKFERLHAKSYLFIKNMDTEDYMERYKAGVIGSSNLTPSGLGVTAKNLELNVIISEPTDLHYMENWFDEIWELGSTSFNLLNVTNDVKKIIDKSKFKNKLENTYTYIAPKDFFTILIKYLNATYLYDVEQKTSLLGFQQLDFELCMRLFREKQNRGIFITSSVGLGKSYVAAQVAQSFQRSNMKTLLIAPPGLLEHKDQWPLYLKKFQLDTIDTVSMGMLSKEPETFNFVNLPEFKNQYGLIIVDEAHNYRNKDSYRNRNLRKIIDNNANSKILFLTATPINTSLEDLVNLIHLFHREHDNPKLNQLFRELNDIVGILKKTTYDKMTIKEKESLTFIQERIERELFVKSTRETIKSSPEYLQELKDKFGADISKIPDPEVSEIKYKLADRYREIINGVIPFLETLTAAHLRILDPNRGIRLEPFFKWLLYKRFESDITSYYLTLSRLLLKNKKILNAVTKRDASLLIESDLDEDLDEYGVEIKFNEEFRTRLSELIKKIKKSESKDDKDTLEDLKKDTELIENQVINLKKLLQSNSKILFLEDGKLLKLMDIFDENSKKQILLFTEYTDTQKAIKEFLENRYSKEEIEFVNSSTKNKNKIVEKFNSTDDPLRILISTDTLSEGYNISGADIVINFDIPYNPVRLVQRIGRATRLDKPKIISVMNFRPDDTIDKEIDLVDRLKLRIESIIRFVGLEYRIWFERERKLIGKRRNLDVKRKNEIKLQILKDVREDMRLGRTEKLENSIVRYNPSYHLIKNAISKYRITREEVEKSIIPKKAYTTLVGKKSVSFFYKSGKTFNDKNISSNIIEIDKKINFEDNFKSDLIKFKEFMIKENLELRVDEYKNTSTDKKIRNIRALINENKFIEKYQDTQKLVKLLNRSRSEMGSTTAKVLNKYMKSLKKSDSNKMINQFCKELEQSFSVGKYQTKIDKSEDNELAIAFFPE